MARANYSETITVPSGPGGSMVPLAAVSATPFTINPDGSEGAEAAAYAGRTGATAASTLVTNGAGYVSYWLDDGDYNIHIADTESSPRIAAYVRGFCAAVLTADALMTAAEGVIVFVGDYKYSHQDSDHGLKTDGTYHWLLVASAGDGGGRLVSQSNYPNLWTKVGAPPIDGSGNFRLPNLSGRTFVATGDASPLSARTRMQLFGEENHVLVTAELAAHAHPIEAAPTGVSVNGGSPLFAGQQGAVTAHALDGHSIASGQASPDTGTIQNWVPRIVPSSTAPDIDWGGHDLNHGHGVTDPTHGHTADNTGSDIGHNTIQPSVGMNLFVKT
jgi:microcystin-dependent protein